MPAPIRVNVRFHLPSPMRRLFGVIFLNANSGLSFVLIVERGMKYRSILFPVIHDRSWLYLLQYLWRVSYTFWTWRIPLTSPPSNCLVARLQWSNWRTTSQNPSFCSTLPVSGYSWHQFHKWTRSENLVRNVCSDSDSNQDTFCRVCI